VTLTGVDNSESAAAIQNNTRAVACRTANLPLQCCASTGLARRTLANFTVTVVITTSETSATVDTILTSPTFATNLRSISASYSQASVALASSNTQQSSSSGTDTATIVGPVVAGGCVLIIVAVVVLVVMKKKSSVGSSRAVLPNYASLAAADLANPTKTAPYPPYLDVAPSGGDTVKETDAL